MHQFPKYLAKKNMLQQLLTDDRNREQLSEIIEIENNYMILEFFSTKKC